MKKTLVFSLGLAAAASANASLLVDRGLPTSNLNNAAGSDRSNVAWVDGGYTSPSSPYTVIGDTFANTSSQTWVINTIQLWSVGPTATAALWGGVEGSGSIGIADSSYSMTDVTYAGGLNYQRTSGPYLGINQIDFTVDITLAPGQTYDFFLDGTGDTYTVPFVHASNAALSGSPQDGSDGLMLQAVVSGGGIDPASITSWTSLGNGWDKASDVNVQVFGTPVPEPSTIIAGVSMVLPFGATALRMLRKRKVA